MRPDNDGIYDSQESGATIIDTDLDGVIDNCNIKTEDKSRLEEIKNDDKSLYFDFETDLLEEYDALITNQDKEFNFFEFEKTKAKACLINKQHVKYLPKKTISILVEDSYKSFAILSNLFSLNDRVKKSLS